MTNPDQVLLATGRGVQFRHGLDSQYGEIKLIMKKDNYLIKKLAERTNIKDIIVDGHSLNANPGKNNPIYFDFWDNKEYSDEEIADKLENEAQLYNFRHLDKDKYDYYKNPNNIARGYCPKDEKKPTWCNIQIHLGNNVSLRHVEAILIPKFVFTDAFDRIIHDEFRDIIGTKKLGDFIKEKLGELFIDQKPNYLYNKLLIVEEADNYEDYYAVVKSLKESYLGKIKSRNRRITDYYDLRDTDKVDKDVYLMQRNPFARSGWGVEGSSSAVATSIEYFKYEERMYMKLLMYNNCFLPQSKDNIEKAKERIKRIDEDESSSESDEYHYFNLG